MTMNGHWGYNAADQNWKSSPDLIRKLADICAKGGNFLLNVGPTAEGEFPAACVERLRDLGRWLRVNGDAIYGTSAGPFAHLSWGVATRKKDKLYLHVFDWPKDGRLRVPLQNAAQAAWLIGSPGQKLAVTREPDCLVLQVPAAAPDAAAAVVVLQVTGEPVVPPLPTVGAKATASAAQPGSGPENALDGTGSKRWRAPADVKSASLEIDLGRATVINGFGFDEPDVWPRINQRYTIEAQNGATWTKIADGRTNGHGLKRALPSVTAQKFRFTLECAAGAPGLAEVQLYRPE
jgi:alpha-L-fucosidase